MRIQGPQGPKGQKGEPYALSSEDRDKYRVSLQRRGTTEPRVHSPLRVTSESSGGTHSVHKPESPLIRGPLAGRHAVCRLTLIRGPLAGCHAVGRHTLIRGPLAGRHAVGRLALIRGPLAGRHAVGRLALPAGRPPRTHGSAALYVINITESLDSGCVLYAYFQH